MATTTNYGWTTPDDTALVKDGAAAIRSLGSAVDTTTKNLNPSTTLGDLEYRSSTANTNTRIPIGTSGQGLQVVAGVPAWAASSTSTLTATGDLLYASAANTLARRGIGTTGQVLTVSGGLPTWSTLNVPISFNLKAQTGVIFNQIAYNGSNLYVGVGSSGALLTSPDGITWTSRTSGFGANRINGITFGNGLFVAVGQNGTITTSSDGTTWTARTANMSTNEINSVVYANSLFVAVGAGGGATNTGGITYSTDGITWTRKSQTPTVGTNYYDVGWNGTNWIVVADNSTNNYLYASAPSGTWTAGADGTGGTLQGYLWDGTRNLVFASSGIMRYSTSTTLGTTTAYAAIQQSFSNQKATDIACIYSGKLYLSDIYFKVFNLSYGSSAHFRADSITINPASHTTTTGTLTNRVRSMFVGASGVMFCDDQGNIFTSF